MNAMSSRSSRFGDRDREVPLWPKVLPISCRVRAGTSAVAGSPESCRCPSRSRGRRRGSGRWRRGRGVLSLDLELHAGDHRGDVVARCGDGDLGDGGGELLGRARARLGSPTCGMLGYSSTGMRQQREAARNRSCTDDPGVLGARTRRVRSAAGSRFGEQPAGDEHAARLLDLGGDLGLRRDLVVERRELTARRPWPR